MARKKSRVGAEDLGIDLQGQQDRELFKWLMACLLFAKPVAQEMAGCAFKELEHERLASPDAIRRAGWQRLVDVLDDAHYVRYDESTATRLLQAVDTLKDRYHGSMRNVVRQSKDRTELSRRLQEFNGIGPKASQIFIRDLARAGWHGAA
jgi:hypothetical protein